MGKVCFFNARARGRHRRWFRGGDDGWGMVMSPGGGPSGKGYAPTSCGNAQAYAGHLRATYRQ